MAPGDGLLAGLDRGLHELNDLAAAHAHQVVVVPPAVELEDRLATLEVVSGDQASTLELGQDPVNGGKADILSGFDQGLVDILRTEVAPVAVLQQGEDLDAWARNLQARLSNLLMLQVLTPPARAIYRELCPTRASGL